MRCKIGARYAILHPFVVPSSQLRQTCSCGQSESFIRSNKVFLTRKQSVLQPKTKCFLQGNKVFSRMKQSVSPYETGGSIGWNFWKQTGGRNNYRETRCDKRCKITYLAPILHRILHQYKCLFIRQIKLISARCKMIFVFETLCI